MYLHSRTDLASGHSSPNPSNVKYRIEAPDDGEDEPISAEHEDEPFYVNANQDGKGTFLQSTL
jgi:hypothetical protein